MAEQTVLEIDFLWPAKYGAGCARDLSLETTILSMTAREAPVKIFYLSIESIDFTDTL